VRLELIVSATSINIDPNVIIGFLISINTQSFSTLTPLHQEQWRSQELHIGGSKKIQLVKTKHNRRLSSFIYQLDVGARIFYMYFKIKCVILPMLNDTSLIVEMIL